MVSAISAIAAAVMFAAMSSAHAADCVKNTEVCVEGPATRDIGGFPVYRDCWRTTSEYSCLSQNSTDDCQPLRDRGCSQVGSSCVETNRRAHAWCSSKPGSAVSPPAPLYCDELRQPAVLHRWPVLRHSHAPDPDFARAVTGLEVQREAGRYLDPNTLEIFKGYDNRCRKKLFGLVNCCKGGGTSGSLFSTMSLISGAGGQAIGAIGSSYTYDALFASDAPDLVIAGFEGLFGAGGGSSALAGLIAGDLSVSSFITSLVPGPWTIAMLAIQLSGLLSCEQAEQILAMKNDNRLCHSVGSYCSIKIPIIGTCVETTQTYCCFNSKLARILNEQGAPSSPAAGVALRARLQRFHRRPAPVSGLLAHGPHGVLRRDRSQDARRRGTAAAGPAARQQLLRAVNEMPSMTRHPTTLKTRVLPVAMAAVAIACGTVQPAVAAAIERSPSARSSRC
jgi:conjugal transfer mating pair stabilization protein TraN